VIGLLEGFSNLVDYIHDTIFQYLLDKFMRHIKIPIKIITTVDFIMNISVFNLVQMILAKYGFAYFFEYVFWLSIII
jgi:hypothetical protein